MSVDRTSPSQSALNALVDAMAPFLKLYETYRANAWTQGLHALELDAWAKAYVSDVERLREAAEQSRLAVEFARWRADQATAERNGAIALVNANQEAFDALRAEVTAANAAIEPLSAEVVTLSSEVSELAGENVRLLTENEKLRAQVARLTKQRNMDRDYADWLEARRQTGVIED